MSLLAPIPPNPADDAVLAQWRTYFLQQVKTIGDESADERVRLAASLGGLRALAQIQSLHQRERRLQQHERGLELAAQHLDIQQQRARREAYRDDYQQAAIETADAADKARTDANPPLRPDEIADIKSKLQIDSQTLSNHAMANYFRGLLKIQAYWSAYWVGSKDASDAARKRAAAESAAAAAAASTRTITPVPTAPVSDDVAGDDDHISTPHPAPSARPASSTATPAPRSPARPAPPAAAAPSEVSIWAATFARPQEQPKALPPPPPRTTADPPVMAAQPSARPEASPNARDPPSSAPRAA